MNIDHYISKLLNNNILDNRLSYRNINIFFFFVLIKYWNLSAFEVQGTKRDNLPIHEPFKYGITLTDMAPKCLHLLQWPERTLFILMSNFSSIRLYQSAVNIGTNQRFMTLYGSLFHSVGYHISPYLIQ